MFGDQKKRVDIDLTNGDKVKVQDIKTKACETFSLHACHMQLWDRGFEDWVDADDHEEVEGNTKVKIKEVKRYEPTL